VYSHRFHDFCRIFSPIGKSRRFSPRGSATGHEVVDDPDDDQNQQQIDQASAEVRDKSEKPEYEQDYDDGPE
jgi:hypothetical protein